MCQIVSNFYVNVVLFPGKTMIDSQNMTSLKLKYVNENQASLKISPPRFTLSWNFPNKTLRKTWEAIKLNNLIYVMFGSSNQCPQNKKKSVNLLDPDGSHVEYLS